MPRAAALVLLLIAATVWGATFPLVKAALADVGPLTFLALRFGLAALLLLPAIRGRGWRSGAERAVLCGLALYAGYVLQTWGLLTTTPARSAFITALAVVLVPMLEPVIGLARPRLAVWAGALVALAGLFVLLRPEARPLSLGDVLTAGCALAFAIHVLLLQWTVRRVAVGRASAIQVATTALIAMPAAAVEGFQVVWSPPVVIAVLVCAVLATVFAFWAMTAAQRVLTAAATAVVLAFEPVAAAMVSVAMGADPISASLLTGGALVVLGVILASIPGGGAVRESKAGEREASGS